MSGDAPEARTLLDYRHAPRPPRAGLERVLAMLLLFCAAYPLLFHAALHGLWLWEYAMNGQSPAPPHHGADNVLMQALYLLVALLFEGGLIVMFVSVLAIGGAIALFPARRRIGLLAMGALVAWPLSVVLLVCDPFRAWWFFLD